MSQIKSKERVAQRGEVFTAEREVNAMLDLVKNECLRPDSRFLEPACGDGNFLSAILRRKLAELRRKYKKSPRDYERQAIVAIGSLYGIDIASDIRMQRSSWNLARTSIQLSRCLDIPMSRPPKYTPTSLTQQRKRLPTLYTLTICRVSNQ